jgi:nucleoside-diphosphate-sugar epimerase
MRILLTGATGFLGSHLAKRLLSDGLDVVIVKRSHSMIDRIAGIMPSLTSYDLDKTSLDEIFEENIDVIIHTATNYGHNEDISNVLESNTLFPLKLLEMAVSHKVKTVINTDTFFNKDQYTDYTYLSQYSLSKKYFLQLAKMLTLQNDIQLINVRLEHLYGPDDGDMKFITSILKNLIKNQPYINLSPGHQKRDFVFINDVVFAFSLIISRLRDIHEQYTYYELGTGVSTSIKDFVTTSHRLTESLTELRFGYLPYRANEIMNSFADNASLKEIGWSTNYNLEKGIKLLVDSLNK